MKEKFFSFFIFLFFSILSFYLTSISVDYIKSLDPIMISINDKKDLYKVDSVNAFLTDYEIIPGSSGLVIDVDSSYEIMKNYGSYNDDLLVYKKVNPVISLSDIYDRFVISGSKEKKEVSLIFKIEDSFYVEDIVYILRDKDVIGTFFVSNEVIKDRFDLVSLIYLNNQKIESLGSNNKYSLNNIDSLNSFYSKYINNTLKFCYSDSINFDILNVCSSRKMHTIVPSINTSNYPYYDIKNNLENGSIIKFSNSYNTINELSYIINYIRQKNYDIVSLEKLLEE